MKQNEFDLNLPKIMISMNHILNEIEVCLRCRCYLAAFSLTMSVIDVCSQIDFGEGGTGSKIAQWYNEHIAKYEIFENTENQTDNDFTVTGSYIRSIRNKIVHNLCANGNMNEANKFVQKNTDYIEPNIDSIQIIAKYLDDDLFSPPTTMSIFDENTATININDFCHTVIAVVRHTYFGILDKQLCEIYLEV